MKKEMKNVLNGLWTIGIITAIIGVFISFIYYSDKENIFKMLESGIILIIILIVFGVDEIKKELRKKQLTAEDIKRITIEELEKIKRESK